MEKASINELPDELLLKILSSLPMVKEAIRTHVISKRCVGLWKLVSALKFDDESYDDPDTFQTFVYRFLCLNKTQGVESIHLKFKHYYEPSHIDFWIQTAAGRFMKELRVDLSSKTLRFPSCLSTYKSLKTLVLRELRIQVVPSHFCLPSLRTLDLLSVRFSGNDSIVSLLRICPVLECLVVNQTKENNVMFEVVPTWFRLPSLKTMHLICVKFSGNEAVASLLRSCPVLEFLVVNQTKDNNVMFEVFPPSFRLPSLKTMHLLCAKFSGNDAVASLLSSCPVLENLVVNRTKYDKVMIFNIDVPTLRTLSIHRSKGNHPYADEIHGFVIKAPSLDNLNFNGTCSNYLVFEDMPMVIKAYVEVLCEQSDKFLGSLTSVQHLSYCAIELCTCSTGWANLLACILNDMPKLQSLKLKSQHAATYSDKMEPFDEPAVVPECLSKHLEILEWRQYEGTEEEIKVAAYILANATCLKMGTFSTRCRNRQHSMLKKVKKMYRVSKTSKLVF